MPPAADPQTDQWTPLGVFGLVEKDQSEPHYVMQLAVDKAGAIAGNYTDTISGTNVPIQGAIGQESAARRVDRGPQQDHRLRDGPRQPDP